MQNFLLKLKNAGTSHSQKKRNHFISNLNSNSKSSKFEFESVRMPRAKLRVYAYHRRPHRRVSQNGLESHVSPRDQIGVMRMVREKIIRGKKHSWTAKVFYFGCFFSASVKCCWLISCAHLPAFHLSKKRGDDVMNLWKYTF